MTADAPVDVWRILDVLRARNPVAAALGISIESAEPGRVRAVMQVREDMANSRGTCHGGYLFLLGDQAGGWTCMTHNEQAVTQSAHITYVSPAQQGEELLADGEEVTKSRRAGTYDVRISTREGRLVAMVRCQYAIIGPTIVEG